MRATDSVLVRLEARSFAVLLSAVFMVSLGYGLLLPALPALLAQTLGNASESAIGRHTGALTGVYLIAVFVFSPLWGAISDRAGRKRVILFGIAGYLLSLSLLSFGDAVWFIYFSRTLSGAFASAVLPVVAAYVSDGSAGPTRVRWFALVSGATLGGFLVGPALFGLFPWDDTAISAAATTSTLAPRTFPFAVSAALGIPLWIAGYRLLPNTIAAPPSHYKEREPWNRSLLPVLVLSVLVTFGLGSFEVGIALQGRNAMDLSPARISLMFVECSVVMAIVQAVLYFQPSSHNRPQRHGLAPAFLAMAVGFALLSIAPGYLTMLVAVALIAGASGALLPVLAHLASLRSAHHAGAVLGIQAAASSLGQAIGSIAGGWLFGTLASSSFWITAVIMLAASIAARASKVSLASQSR